MESEAEAVNEKVTKKLKTQKGDGNDVFGIEGPIDDNYFTLEIMGSKSFHQTEAAQEITYKAKLKYPAPEKSLSDLEPHLTALFESLIEEMERKYGERGIARIYIDHPNLEKAIIITPRYIGEMKVKDILGYIDDVVNSAGEIPADDSLDINVAVIRTLLGSGRRYIYGISDLIKKKSIVTIQNNDKACLARAVVVGLAHMNLRKDPKNRELKKFYDRIRDSRKSLQRIKAEQLMQAVGIPNRVGSLDDVKAYEDYLKINIIVVSWSCQRQIYSGSNQYDDRIYILHTQESPDDIVGHFDTITKIGGVLCRQYHQSKTVKHVIKASRTGMGIAVKCGVMFVEDPIVKRQIPKSVTYATEHVGLINVTVRIREVVWVKLVPINIE